MEPNEMLKIVENALYRQTPKKPEMEKYTKRKLYFCPICGTDVTDCNFCPNCGQAIGFNMTKEEQVDWLFRLRSYFNDGVIFTPFNKEFTEALTCILDQESKNEQFVKWVATEIFDDMWELNKDSFAEIACRKLKKIGIVRVKDDLELVERDEEE